MDQRRCQRRHATSLRLPERAVVLRHERKISLAAATAKECFATACSTAHRKPPKSLAPCSLMMCLTTSLAGTWSDMRLITCRRAGRRAGRQAVRKVGGPAGGSQADVSMVGGKGVGLG